MSIFRRLKKGLELVIKAVKDIVDVIKNAWNKIKSFIDDTPVIDGRLFSPRKQYAKVNRTYDYIPTAKKNLPYQRRKY